MSTKYIASNWRLPNQENSSKNDNYGLIFSPSDNDFIELTRNSHLEPENITVVCWVNITSGSHNNCYYFSKIDISGNSASYGLYKKQPQFFIKTSTGTKSSPQYSSSIVDAGWTHLVGTYDGVNIRLYVDGLEVGTGTAETGTITYSTENAYIGSFESGLLEVEGKISEAAVFDYALTSTQISTLYGSSSLGSGNPMALKPQPVAYYPLGDNSASNPLTQPNVAVEDASVFDFDGTNPDEINCGTGIGDIIGDSYTGGMGISLWFKTDSTGGGEKGLFIFSGGVDAWGEITAYFAFNNLYIRVKGVLVLTHAFTDTTSWHNLLINFLGPTESNQIYLDGAAIGSPFTYTDLDLNGETLNIGYTHSTTFDYQGQMSNIAIWNSEQSSEISNIYNSGVPATSYTNTPTAWYKLNNTANWEADSAGNWQIPEAVSAYPQSFKCDSGWIDLNGSNLAPILNGLSNFTLSLWYNQDAVSNRFLFDIKDGTNRMALQLVNAATNYLYFNSSYNSYSAVDTPINQWNNLVFVFDGSQANADRIKLYINGSQITAATTGTIDSTLGSFGSSTVANLGAASTGGSLYALNGKISNCQIFNSSLPATGTDSVETLYNNGSPLTTAIASSNLKLWAKLDNNEKFDGTNWSVENQKYPANYETALDFDRALNTQIRIPNSSSLNLSASHSISFWLSPTSQDTFAYIFNKQNLDPSIYYSSGNLTYAAYNLPISGGGTFNIDKIIYSGFHTAFNNNGWVYCCVTLDQPNLLLKFYVNGAEHSSQSIDSRYIGLAHQGNQLRLMGYSNTGHMVSGQLSNVAIFNTALSLSQVQTLYNNGTPEALISHSPVSWWKLNNLTTGIQDSVGSNDGTNYGATKVNTFVSTEAATSSGMTEQNLVNNNVSALNGESSGMTSANLVTSDLTRAIPYDNYSFNFDAASSDYIDCGDVSFLDGSAALTLSAWVKPTASGTSSADGIIAKDGATRGFYLATFTGDKFRFLISTNGSTNDSFNSSLAYTTNEWYHLAATWDGTNLKLYINGLLDTTQAASNATGTIQNNSNTLRIGNNGGSGYANAIVNNTSIFNEALTSTEVMKLYSNGVPQDLSSFTPQPVAWYPLGSNSFWNGSAWTCRDMIGSNDGTGQNIGADGLVGDAPRSEANGTGTNMDVPSNLEGNTKWSSNNSYSVNMSSLARVEDVA